MDLQYILNKFRDFAKIISFFLFANLLLISCVGSKTDAYFGYQKSGPINSYDGQRLRLRQKDIINAIRIEQNLIPLSISRELNASAETHALDIANQKRAWNFGSDASSPQERAKISGFDGTLTGENVSETFEGEFDVLQVWLKYNLSREVILNPLATHLGLGWFQEENGKTWWVQNIGYKN